MSKQEETKTSQLSSSTVISPDNWALIIVGAGTAGMPCAIIAAENGAKVVVVEKDSEIGGTLHVSGGIMSGAGTRRQQVRGIEDSPDLHFEDLMRISHGNADPTLVRLAVNEAPYTIDWLDDLGFPFAPETPIIPPMFPPYSRPRVYFSSGALTSGGGKTVLATIRPRWDELVASGKITVLLNHKLINLIRDGNTVVGVNVCGPESIIELRGKAIVLTTGGYGSNPDLFAEVTPGNPKSVTVARKTSTGDGILAARQIGAQFQNGEKYSPILGGIEVEPGSGRADWWGPWARIQSSDLRLPCEIYVNERGERFIAEDEPSSLDRRAQSVLRQVGSKFWVVFDEAALQTRVPLFQYWTTEQFRAKATEGKVAWCANDIGELARTAGIDADGLVQTIKQFNESVYTGKDPLGRTHLLNAIEKPPFYALLTHCATLITFGGLAVDGQLRVLDEQGVPIPRLYAAGEIIGAGATNGDGVACGMAVTPAISFGRMLGRSLSN